MSLRCNYNAWKHFFYGTNLSKKKCLQKFYEFIFYNGLSDKKFRKRRQRNKIKKVIKCVYHLFLKSDEEDKNNKVKVNDKKKATTASQKSKTLHMGSSPRKPITNKEDTMPLRFTPPPAFVAGAP